MKCEDIKKAYDIIVSFLYLVPRAGIEPARLAARDFESRASTNSATWACLGYTLLYNCDPAIIASYT